MNSVRRSAPTSPHLGFHRMTASNDADHVRNGACLNRSGQVSQLTLARGDRKRLIFARPAISSETFGTPLSPEGGRASAARGIPNPRVRPGRRFGASLGDDSPRCPRTSPNPWVLGHPRPSGHARGLRGLVPNPRPLESGTSSPGRQYGRPRGQGFRPSPKALSPDRPTPRDRDLGKEKLPVLLGTWCEEHGLARPSVSRSGGSRPRTRQDAFCHRPSGRPGPSPAPPATPKNP